MVERNLILLFVCFYPYGSVQVNVKPTPVMLDSSFRCLDEFDVFMDAVNRRESIKLIIDHARKTGPDRTNCQYILITPQDMKTAVGADIHIFRMRDPERGQTALNVA